MIFRWHNKICSDYNQLKKTAFSPVAEVGPEGAKKKEKEIVIKRGKNEPFGFVSNKFRPNSSKFL